MNEMEPTLSLVRRARRAALSLVVALVSLVALSACSGPQRKDPPPPAAQEHLRIGEQYMKQGYPEKAIVEFEGAQMVAPQSYTVKMALGNGYRGAGYLDRAISTYTQASELWPESPNPQNEMGIIYGQKSLTKEAEEQFDASMKKVPEKGAGSKYTDPWFNKGVLYLSLNRNDEAKDLFLAVLQRDPNVADAHVNLALIDLNNGYFEGAEQRLQAALKLRPDHAVAIYNLGLSFLMQNRPERAIAEFKKAIAKEPKYVQAYNNMGVAYRNISRPESARACFKKALDLDSQNEFARGQMRELDQEKAQGGGR